MTHWPRSWDYPEDNEDEMTPEQMIHRLRDMGRYWDDGLPQPSECADMLEELMERIAAERQAHEATIAHCDENHEDTRA